jgi:hypothetical protein
LPNETTLSNVGALDHGSVSGHRACFSSSTDTPAVAIASDGPGAATARHVDVERIDEAQAIPERLIGVLGEVQPGG